MLLYLIKVNLAICLLYLFYRLLFRNDTFFGLRRYTLLCLLFISFLYPLPDIQNWVAGQPLLYHYVEKYSALFHSGNSMNVNETFSADLTLIPEEETLLAPIHPVWRWQDVIGDLLLFIYCAGVFLLLFRILKELLFLFITKRKSALSIIDGIPVYTLPADAEPHSFFKWIFIGKGTYSDQRLSEILIHEQAHARQFHSLDILLIEIAGIICWFNPFIRLLKQEIGINHEFIADQEVLKAGYNKKKYQYHLIGIEHPTVAAANLYNHFSVLPLKKRITMLNKERTHYVRTVKYLTLLPLVAVLLILNNMEAMARLLPSGLSPATTSEMVTSPLPPDDEVYPEVEIMPQFPGGESELLKYVLAHINYPEEAKKKGISGRVIISFIVEKDGSVSTPTIIRGVEPSIDKDAIRVVESLPKWTPGKHKGEIVRVRYIIPVQYRIKPGLTPVADGQGVVMYKGEPLINAAHEMPRYPGGDAKLNEFIYKEMNYPLEAAQKGLEGRVVIGFVVEKDGTPADFKVLRGIDPALDKEALRIISKMPKWTPGTYDGKVAHVRHTIPVRFSLR